MGEKLQRDAETEKLDEWEAICDAATEWWRLEPDNDFMIRGHQGPILESYGDRAMFVLPADAVFTVTARTAMPELITMVRGLMELVPCDDDCLSLLTNQSPRRDCNCTRGQRIAKSLKETT